MNSHTDIPSNHSRRQMLQSVSCGFGYLAFAGMCARAAPPDPLSPREPHFRPRAKRVIFLCMGGGPSHLDTFDYKPKLQADAGRDIEQGNQYQGTGGKLLASQWKFAQHGQSGLWISELFPNLSKHGDKLCLLNGMYTDLPSHPHSFVKMHTGNSQFVRPSLGAWSLYGLGTESENLPGFMVLNPSSGNGGAQNYGSAFLPATYQATAVRGSRGQISNISNRRMSREQQRAQLDLVQSLNQGRLEQNEVDPDVEGVIDSFELAFKMQTEAPRLMDVNRESFSVRRAYGIGNRATDNFGRQCLLARRLAESGVRFIELNYGNWDHHRGLKSGLERNCQAIDKPIAALLADLENRDMLKDTLVMWGGEFGRTPHGESTDGRDHNNRGYTMWMAGGGVKGGMRYGQTDEYGFAAVEDRMHIHDWHATVLHLLGLDHKRLTFNYSGRDFRLTDVHGEVATKIIA
ncbi:MAG: sulfatase [Ectothiorhodospiraceae bacterium]|nr:sulfatase [Ectothiorhodospiraceae bacterium]